VKRGGGGNNVRTTNEIDRERERERKERERERERERKRLHHRQHNIAHARNNFFFPKLTTTDYKRKCLLQREDKSKHLKQRFGRRTKLANKEEESSRWVGFL
jgi:hypothetical protein